MEVFIKAYYDDVKDLLIQGASEEVDHEELNLEVKRLEKQFGREIEKRTTQNKFIFDGEEAVYGLLQRFYRLYGDDSQYVTRDSETSLALKLDYGWGFEMPLCPYSEDEYIRIQQNITARMAVLAKTPTDEFEQPLILGEIKKMISKDEVNFIVKNLSIICSDFIEYIESKDNGQWNWNCDCYYLAQYLFEKAIEITYYVANKKDLDNISYLFADAFKYKQVNVPNEMQESIDSAVNRLENVVMETLSYIEDNNYHLCNKAVWLYRFLLNIGLFGLNYTLEHDNY